MPKRLPVLLFLVFCMLFEQKSSAQSDLADSVSMYYDLADVVVTAQYAPTDSREALYKIRTIKREVMEKRGVNNLEQLLNQELNIRISQDLILGSSMNLQGISGQNVKIMIDGVPVIGRVGDDIDLSQINLSNIERVEIIEGPVSVNYGTNALGGVINLITKKSQLGKLEVKLNSQYESIGTYFLNTQLGVRPIKKVLWRADAGYQHFDGFNAVEPTDISQQRTYQWNPKTQWFGNSLLRLDLGKDRQLRWQSGYFQEEIENLGPVRRPQFKPYAFDEYYHTQRLDQSLAYEGRLSDKLYGHLTAAYNKFRREKESLRYDMETSEKININAEEDTTRYQSIVFRPVVASRFPGSKVNFQAGLDFNYEEASGKRFNEPGSDGNFNAAIGDYAGFLTLQVEPLSGLDIQLGARAAWNTKFDAPVIPSLHLKYDFSPNWQLRASYATGFRSPSVKELFFYFVDASHFIIGNPDLGAETSRNVQAVLDFQKSDKQNFKVSLTGFFNDINNKIELFDFVEVNGEMVPAAALGQTSTRFAYFNQERYKTLGMNLRSAIQWHRLGLEAGIAPIGRYNPISALGLADTYTYTTEISGQARYRFPSIQLEGTFFIRYNDNLIRYYQGVDTEGNPITYQAVQEGFTMADLVFTKTFGKSGVSLSGGLKNVFDVTNVNTLGTGGRTHSGSGNSSPIATGRNYFLRAQFSLEQKN